MKKSILIMLVLFLSSGLFAQNDIDGFRGLKWGTPFSDLSEKLVPSKNKTPGFKGYDMKDENFSFEGITAHTITYVFKKNLLYGVNIGVFNKDLDKLVAVFTGKYGDPKVTDTPFLVNYEWHLEKTDIAITNFPTNKSDKSTTIAIGKKK